MEVVLRRDVREMITANSNRIGFPDLEPNVRDRIHERVRHHVLAITMDGKLIHGLIVCKYCQNLYTNAKWSMARIMKHLDTFHLTPLVGPVAKGVAEEAAEASTVETPIPVPVPVAKLESLPPPDLEIPPGAVEAFAKALDAAMKKESVRIQPRMKAAAKKDKNPLAVYEKLHNAIDKIEHAPLSDREKMDKAIPILDQMDQMRAPPVDAGLSLMEKAKRAAYNHEWRARAKAKQMKLTPSRMNI